MSGKIYQEQLGRPSKLQIDGVSRWRALTAAVALALTAPAAVVAQEMGSAPLLELVVPSQVVVVSYDGASWPARFNGELHAPFDDATAEGTLFKGYRPQFYIRTVDVSGDRVGLEGTELLILKEADVLAVTASDLLIRYKGVLLQQGRPLVDEAVDVEGYALAVSVGDTSTADEFGRYRVHFQISFDGRDARAANREPLPWTWTAYSLLRLRATESD